MRWFLAHTPLFGTFLPITHSHKSQRLKCSNRVPICAVSGTFQESDGLSMGTEGVDDWFLKPLVAQLPVQQEVISLCRNDGLISLSHRIVRRILVKIAQCRIVEANLVK